MKPLNTISKIESKYTGKEKTRTYTYRGVKKTDHHYGIDLLGTKDILACADGKVIQVVNSGVQYGTCCKVRIQHKDYQSAYYHLKSGSIVVKKGDYVKTGTKLGTMGTTGTSTGVHLHFQIDKGSNATAIDPIEYALGNKELIGLESPYKDLVIGANYEFIVAKYVRTSPKVSVNKYLWSRLTANAKKKCHKDKYGYAVYNLGAQVSFKEFKTDASGNIWGRTNTLWVCVFDKTGYQVRLVEK